MRRWCFLRDHGPVPSLNPRILRQLDHGLGSVNNEGPPLVVVHGHLGRSDQLRPRRRLSTASRPGIIAGGFHKAFWVGFELDDLGSRPSCGAPFGRGTKVSCQNRARTWGDFVDF